MKFIVHLKDPDCLSDAIREAVEAEVKALPGLDDSEREEIVTMRAVKVGSVTAQWFQYSECLEVEVDTEANTCVVLKAKR